MRFLKFIPYLIVLLSATYLVRFPLGIYGSINLLDAFIILFVAFFFWTVYRNKLYGNLLRYLENKIVLLLFLSVMFLGIFFSFLKNFNIAPLNSLGLIKSYFVLPILFALISDFLIKSKKTKLAICIFAYFAYASLLSLLGVVYLILNQLTFDGRLRAFFQSPNQLAISIAPGIIIGIYYLAKKKPQLAWFILLFLVLIQVFCLWKTASLGVWIGLFFAFLVLCCIHFNLFKQATLFASILLFSLFSLFLLFNLEPLINKINPFENINSTNSRLIIYQVGSRLIKDNVFWGIGAGNFQEVYLLYQKDYPPFPQWAVPHSHHLFSQFWIEFGFLTFLAFLGIISYQTLIKQQKKSPVLLGAILIYFIIHGLFDVTIWKNDSALFFWFILLVL